jgi:hypothetical protein
VSRATQDTNQLHNFTSTGLSPSLAQLSSCIPVLLFQYLSVLLPRYCRNSPGLGYSHFARRYYGNHYCFLLLQVLRCFSSLGSLPYLIIRIPVLQVGYPIRKSPDQRSLAPPQSLSQLCTSFFASESLGIHRTPLVTFFKFARVCSTYSFISYLRMKGILSLVSNMSKNLLISDILINMVRIRDLNPVYAPC